MKRQGFTLIELAIALTIMGIVIGGSFQAMKTFRERNKRIEAKEMVKTAKDAIVGYALEYVDLPTLTEFNTDLSPRKGTQAPMLYFSDPKLANDNDICAFSSTDLNVTLYSAGTLNRSISDVAFVVAAASANHNLQTAATGANPYEVRVDDPAYLADRNSIDYTRVEEFDDEVEWMTLVELQQLVGCMDKPLRFLNNRLPNAKLHQAYSAQLYVENNISTVTFNCLPGNDKNITVTSDTFSSLDVNETGTALFTCTATEAPPSSRSVTKQYVITIDP